MDNQSTLNHLRLDKIIYAVEATCFSVTAFFVYIFAEKYFTGMIQNITQIGALVICLFYTLFMGFGNLNRLGKIRKLEAKL